MTAIIEDYSPVYVGDTGSIFAPQFLYANGNPVVLTGATISMKMTSQASGTVQTCRGTWVIDDAANGQAHYQWQTADLATPGNWLLSVTITTTAGPFHADPKLLTIAEAP